MKKKRNKQKPLIVNTMVYNVHFYPVHNGLLDRSTKTSRPKKKNKKKEKEMTAEEFLEFLAKLLNSLT